MNALLSEMGRTATDYWRQARPPQRTAYVVGAGLILVGLGHALVWLVVGGSVDGPLSWRKPVTFGVSFGLATATLAWVSQYLALSERALRYTLVPLAVANTVEVAWVSVQRARGVPSHFNLSTSFDGALFAANGAAIVVTITVIAVYTVRAFTASTASPSMTLALRVGMLILLASMATGVWMILRGVPPQALPDPVRVGESGSLKVAHAVGMHGIQVLAGLAWLASFTALPEARRVRIVALGAAGYTLATVSTMVVTALGASPLAAGTVGLLVNGVAVLALVVAGAQVFTALVRRARLADTDPALLQPSERNPS